MQQNTSINLDQFKKLNCNNYDYVLVGDGSGSTIQTSIGYSAFVLDVARESILQLEGYWNHGTVNQSEILPTLLLLNYLESSNILPPVKILVISDSEVTVNCGNKKWARNANKFMWAGLDYFESVGYKVEFRWVKRNTNLISKECDRISKEMRRS